MYHKIVPMKTTTRPAKNKPIYDYIAGTIKKLWLLESSDNFLFLIVFLLCKCSKTKNSLYIYLVS